MLEVGVVLLHGDGVEKPHVRIDADWQDKEKLRLTVSETGSQPTSYGGRDGRQEKGIPLTRAELRRLAFRLLAEIEG